MKQHSTFTTTTSSQTGFSIAEMEKAIKKLPKIPLLRNKLILVSKKHYKELDRQMRKHPANPFSFEIDDFMMGFSSCRIMVKPYLKKMRVIDINPLGFYHSNPVLDPMKPYEWLQQPKYHHLVIDPQEWLLEWHELMDEERFVALLRERTILWDGTIHSGNLDFNKEI